MLKSASELFRRSFLGSAWCGTAGYLFSVERWMRTETAMNLNSPAAPTSSDLTNLYLHEVASMIKEKKISPVEITHACLARIEQLNPSLNAFITITADSAIVQARQAESEVQRGEWRGPLHGIPIALKDLIDTAGVRTTAASALFKDRIPEEDATVVRLLRNAGAILLGKLNMHEFAYGSTSAASYFGRVSNPWNHEYITGGSSGGSATAVAAGLCYGALGSDTGGSIREPAAYCGIVGLKPTYGRVSTRGVIPLSWSADHIGPMTRSVEDAAIMLQVIAGYDANEVTSYDAPVEDYVSKMKLNIPSLRVGIPHNFFYDGLDPEIQAATEGALASLEKLGAKVREIKMEVNADRAVVRAEAYAWHLENMAKHPELYLPETLAKLRLGASIEAATYIKARHQVEQLRREIPKLFATVDVLVTPTTPVPPPKAADLPTKFEEILAEDTLLLRNTRTFDLSGLPTISVPCGFTKAGLPIGLQISGAPWQEAVVLRLALAYQQATSWHLQHPGHAAESHSDPAGNTAFA
jgi:aspartyl-tRNA(Asn)/glutamyl-tRNA(Gln) amidotransferase subunit A